MNYRRLGRTNLKVSVVGFGTCQLRLVPDRQAIATLLRGFELGVNLVHQAGFWRFISTAPFTQQWSFPGTRSDRERR